jgi:hypothetical protein
MNSPQVLYRIPGGCVTTWQREGAVALPSVVTTRVDQLHADLRRIQKAHAKKATVPDTTPMFRRHDDGAVYDRAGNVVRAAVKANK